LAVKAIQWVVGNIVDAVPGVPSPVATRDRSSAAKFVDSNGCLVVLRAHAMMIPGITISVQSCLNATVKDKIQAGAVNRVFHVKKLVLLQVVEDLAK
ncbi:hypothetical protein R3P38DRAFT_2473266, partial [Favolaschia claudopus]